MKKIICYSIVLQCLWMVSSASAQAVTAIAQAGPSNPNESSFEQSKYSIQNNYNQLYSSLPLDLQTRVRSASNTIDNIRMMSTQEAQVYVAGERLKSDQYMSGTISQMVLSDEVKTQVDNSRKEVFTQINNRMNEFKARRAYHR